MNEMNEIIIDIDKDKKKNKNKENKKKQLPIKINSNRYDLNYWLLALKEKMYKRAYKKVLKDITTLGLIDQYKTSELGYKIIIIFIQAKLKVIENKIYKYHIAENEISKHQINKCIFYAKTIPDDIKSLFEFIPKKIFDESHYYKNINKRNYIIEYTDDMIRCYCDYIYTMAIFNFKINNYIKSISYLCLGLQLYEISKNYILSPHTLFKIEKCLILLSKIFILNEDYENALPYLNDAIKICFKQIIFQVHDIFYGFFIGEEKDIKSTDKSELEKLKDSRMVRIILKIVIIFLYLGICYENMSQIKKATAFYKQSEWFARVFLSKNNNILYKLFSKLKKKSIDVCNIIDFLKKKITEVDKIIKKKLEELLREEEMKKNGADTLCYDIKFKGLVDKLENLKIKEIDTINLFESNNDNQTLSKTATNKSIKEKNMYMSNIKLLEAYLSKDFRDLVSGMKTINIFDINNITRSKIQKVIDKMHYAKKQKKIKNEKLSTSQDTIHKKIFTLKRQYFQKSLIENDKQDNDRYSKLKESPSDNKAKMILNLSANDFMKKQIENNSIKENTKSNLLLNKEQYELINSKRERNNLNSSYYGLLINNSLISPQKKTLNNTPKNNTFINNINSPKKLFDKKKNNMLMTPRVTKNHYFLNLGYLKKRNYIKKLADREFKFQKCLIRTKKSPIPNIHYFNKGLSRIEADNSFLKIKSIVSNSNINNDWKEIMSQRDYRDFMMKSRLENALLSSLDNSALEKYKTMIYKKDKEELDETVYEKSLRNVKKVNKTALENLTLKLNTIYENEQKSKNEQFLKNMKIRKQIIKRLYKNKSSTTRGEGKRFIHKKLKFSSSANNISNMMFKK